MKRLNQRIDIEAHILQLHDRLSSGQERSPTFTTFGEAQSLEDIVAHILDKVKNDGDLALSELSLLIDKCEIDSTSLIANTEEFEHAKSCVPEKIDDTLRFMMKRIENYAKAMMPQGEVWFGEDGGRLGYRFTPIQNIGAYVPGGLAGSTPLISTVLMNIVPAKVAGVKEIVVATPSNKEGKVHPYLLRACELAGVSKVLKVGGAQAIAAMAYGTTSVPRCSKIIGPGNAFVQEAKKQLFGLIDIDMMAGPSEIAIIADESANPVHLASDLIAQAEHDELAASVIFSPEAALFDAVEQEVEDQLKRLPRSEIAKASLDAHGALCKSTDLDEACDLANQFAPEHLELCVEEPHRLLPKIKDAGAIFLGHFSPEVVGDYTAGPSHTLPTCGAARFTGGITVYTFLKSSSLIEYDLEHLKVDVEHLSLISRSEQLEGHARSGEYRVKNKKS